MLRPAVAHEMWCSAWKMFPAHVHAHLQMRITPPDDVPELLISAAFTGTSSLQHNLMMRSCKPDPAVDLDQDQSGRTDNIIFHSGYTQAVLHLRGDHHEGRRTMQP